MANIGLLGIGAMGSRMATRLLAAGHEVTIWNRTRSSVHALEKAGVRVAGTPRESKVRKTVLVVGMLFRTAVLGATQTTDPVWAITWISIALGGLASAAPVSWSLPSLIAPKGGVSTAGGIMNFSNNMMGVIAPRSHSPLQLRASSWWSAYWRLYSC